MQVNSPAPKQEKCSGLCVLSSQIPLSGMGKGPVSALLCFRMQKLVLKCKEELEGVRVWD